MRADVKGDRSDKGGYGDLLEQVYAWSSFIIANLLWVLFSLPLVTIPAATGALFSIMMVWVRGRRPEPIEAFFSGLRRTWWRSTRAFGMNLLLALPLLFNVLIVTQAEAGDLLMVMARSVTVFTLLVLVALNLYLCPLLAAVRCTLMEAWRAAFALVFAHSLWTLSLLVLAALPIVISLFLPSLVFVLFTAAATAYIISWGAWRIIRRYSREDEDGELVLDFKRT